MINGNKNDIAKEICVFLLYKDKAAKNNIADASSRKSVNLYIEWILNPYYFKAIKRTGVTT